MSALKTSPLAAFLRSEASGGLLLMATAAAALVIANTPAAPWYFAAVHAPLGGLDLLHWINDGLMAVFFLLVGMEIKREMIEGELRSAQQRILPGLAALGGMIMPALIYTAANLSGPYLHGWAIPTATDIAFSLGVLALLGSRVPAGLKLFLTALAILDDLGAVAIIGLFYTSDIAWTFLGLAGLALAALALLNRRGVTALWPYLLLGALLWLAMLQSGVHPTLAGVALAFALPLRTKDRRSVTPPLLCLEHALAPWVGFGILPVFGFANAGVSLAGLQISDLLAPIPLGVAAGLFAGKQAGVFAAAFIAIRCRWSELPRGVTWTMLYGTALLCGIGFTISLFIGGLAFSGASAQDAAKIGVLSGSLLSALAGWTVLRFARTPRA